MSLSKECINELKGNKEDKEKEKNKEKNKTKNKNDESELKLNESYNNKSIIEILNNNCNISWVPNKIFIFKSKSIDKANLLDGNELNPKFKF